MKERDLEEFYTDLLLLRVEKKTLAIMRGEVGLNETDVAVRGEQRMALLKRMHLDKHAKISQVNSKISASIRDRRAENERLKGQLRELEASVKARESIYRSRLDGGGEMSAQQKAQKRMKRVTMRRRLIDLGRVQTEEIDFLRQELDRLRQRTFPSFAHAARHRLLLPPDEIV
jgi:flagella basal body P-ring formation protein FlgA